MLYWAAVFFVIALIAAIFWFRRDLRFACRGNRENLVLR